MKLILTTGMEEPSLSLVEGIDCEVAMVIYKVVMEELQNRELVNGEVGHT